MLDRQRVQQAAADEAKKLVDAAALAAERLVDATKELRKQRQRPRRQLHCQRPKKHRSQPEWFDRHCGLLICARVSDCHGSLLLSNWRVVIPDICHIL